MTAGFSILPRTPGILFEDADIAVHGFTDGCLDLLDRHGTTFFAVGSGSVVVNDMLVGKGMYGCVPGKVSFADDGPCRVLIAQAKTYRGIMALGGPIEASGRLRYINGCTDTGLIQPLKRGDPCLNALFFPAGTLQTPHRHPSHRVGLIHDGEGLCLTGKGDPTPMRAGDVFVIPANALHWFETTDSAMRIMIFHPDSEVGPTDEHHQMLEATIVA